jgi:putative transcriptional regulator
MTDTARLKDIIAKSGLKKTFIADKLGISYQGYCNKENGKSEFLQSEIVTMKSILNLSNKDISEIFLSNK